jgi:hypothetical protein
MWSPISKIYSILELKIRRMGGNCKRGVGFLGKNGLFSPQGHREHRDGNIEHTKHDDRRNQGNILAGLVKSLDKLVIIAYIDGIP